MTDDAYDSEVRFLPAEILVHRAPVHRAPRNHVVKVWPTYFQATMEGDKLFEIRENDRDYRIGDELTLREWDPDRVAYTGRAGVCRITYVSEFMQKPGWVVLGITEPG